MIVFIYAALLALMFVFFSLRVVAIRRRDKVSLGDQDNPALRRAVRVHGNFAEYAPIAILMLFFVEQTGLPILWLHMLCGLLIFGRILHAYGVGKRGGHMVSRVLGMVLTFLILLASACILLFQSLYTPI